MRNGVLAITRDGRLTLLNDEARRVLDLAVEEDRMGLPFGEILQDHPEVARVLGSAFELSHLPNRAELRLKASGRVIGYTLSRIQDDEGTVTGVALLFKDLTRVEQLEEQERLRDRLAALGEMAAAIAHELKNPLAGIEVMAGLLRRRIPDAADVQSLLDDIISESKIANAIVHEALEFVRPIRLQVEHTSIAQVLHDAIRLAEGQVSRRDVAVTMSVGAHLPLIEADHYQLCQVFANLLINALEALDGTGTIAITASPAYLEEDRAEGHLTVPTVTVDVADTGPGIAPEIADKIFNPFFTSKPRGSGLGLAIVRKILDAHDGRIDVNSAPGQGTRFRVTLPVSGGSQLFK
jgi:signal transduction histidine kinase